MNIGIIGASTVGITLARQFVSVGHKVQIANSRGRASLESRLGEVDTRLSAASVSEVCECELVILAVPWTRVRQVLSTDTEWEGRILVDVSNIFLSYSPDFRVDDLQGDSGSEIVSRLAPTARTVKAFNTLPFEKLFAPHDPAFRRVLFVAGDDTSAVSTVMQLVAELGLLPISLGSLAIGGRMMELNGALNGIELFSPAE